MLSDSELNKEVERLKALYELSILDTPPEERYDKITRFVQEYFRCKICLISLVAEDRQWFKSRQGLDVCETPRDISFCTYAIAEEEYLVIPDSHQDDRFANNPLVTGAPFIRAYAGVIVRSPDDYELGTLCAIDDVPREFSEQDIAMLKEFGSMVEQEIKKGCQ
ncbi:GAF domain-containing protein [Alteromonas sp. ASW11-130]|uniref:GAF domain-containing protein n=1 Tax=Alteromonas sp. ASW11-130 TaxID=3015775 RepID=UPI002242991F|nr:GAF domain-containing protein [Alteromonas sp. ASW11-130]MCW8091240.1 GAF domain-containing protein [Alteromonas sp. ASW11-130]